MTKMLKTEIGQVMITKLISKVVHQIIKCHQDLVVMEEEEVGVEVDQDKVVQNMDNDHIHETLIRDHDHVQILLIEEEIEADEIKLNVTIVKVLVICPKIVMTLKRKEEEETLEIDHQ